MVLHPYSVLGFHPATGQTLCAHVLAQNGLHAFAEAAQQCVGGDHVFIAAHPGHLRENQDVFFPESGRGDGAPGATFGVDRPNGSAPAAAPGPDVRPAAPGSQESAPLHIVIPKADTALARQIKAGSGVVMRQTAQGLVLDYEGNLYGAEILSTYAERLKHAAGRAATNYPTLARLWLRTAADVEIVGDFDVGTWRVRLATDTAAQAALARWGVSAADTPAPRGVSELVT